MLNEALLTGESTPQVKDPIDVMPLEGFFVFVCVCVCALVMGVIIYIRIYIPVYIYIYILYIHKKIDSMSSPNINETLSPVGLKCCKVRDRNQRMVRVARYRYHPMVERLDTF